MISNVIQVRASLCVRVLSSLLLLLLLLLLPLVLVLLPLLVPLMVHLRRVAPARARAHVFPKLLSRCVFRARIWSSGVARTSRTDVRIERTDYEQHEKGKNVTQALFQNFVLRGNDVTECFLRVGEGYVLFLSLSHTTNRKTRTVSRAESTVTDHFYAKSSDAYFPYMYFINYLFTYLCILPSRRNEQKHSMTEFGTRD